MGVEENLYRAPEATVVERPAYQARPLPVFLAGALCFGASVPFLMMSAGAFRGLVMFGIEDGWFAALTNRHGFWAMGVVMALCIACEISLLMAGRRFLDRRGREGREILLVFAAAFLALVAWVFYIYT